MSDTGFSSLDPCEVRSLHNRGATYAEIADWLGYSVSAVSKAGMSARADDRELLMAERAGQRQDQRDAFTFDHRRDPVPL